MIDFSAAPFVPYGGGGQNLVGGATASPDGTTVTSVGNNWQAFPYAVTIQPDTLLEFDFSSTVQGEVHGIGLDTQTDWTDTLADKCFQLYGTQTWGIQDYRNGVAHYSIPIGTFFTGVFAYLVFANDHDVPSPNAVSEFSNVEFVDPPPADREAELEAVLVEIRDLAVEAVGA